MQDKCIDCDYFVAHEDNDNLGDCHAYPPVIAVCKDTVNSYYPIVNADNVGCSEGCFAVKGEEDDG